MKEKKNKTEKERIEEAGDSRSGLDEKMKDIKHSRRKQIKRRREEKKGKIEGERER